MERTLLDLGSQGQRIKVVAAAAPLYKLTEPRLTRGRIEVEAHPFSGVIETIFTDGDIDEYSDALSRLRSTKQVRCGGGRAPLVALELDGDVTEVTVIPSEDDPWPTLRYLIFPVLAAQTSVATE